MSNENLYTTYKTSGIARAQLRIGNFNRYRFSRGRTCFC